MPHTVVTSSKVETKPSSLMVSMKEDSALFHSNNKHMDDWSKYHLHKMELEQPGERGETGRPQIEPAILGSGPPRATDLFI